MKFEPFLALCLALAPAVPASAQVIDCAEWQEMASFTMRMRQVGVPISEALATARKTQEETDMPEGYREFMDKIVLHAYGRALERTERGVDVAAIDYGEEILRLCVASRSR